MKKSTMEAGGAMLAFGIIGWIVIRLMGGYLIFGPLLTVGGLITIIVGLFQEDK